MSNDEQMVTHVDLDGLNDVDSSEGLNHDGEGLQQYCHGCDYWHEPLDKVKKVLNLEDGSTYDGNLWVPDDGEYDYEENVSDGWRCDDWVTRDEPSGRTIQGAWVCPNDWCYYPYGAGDHLYSSDEARSTAKECCELEAEDAPTDVPISAQIEAKLSPLGYLQPVDLDAIAQKH